MSLFVAGGGIVESPQEIIERGEIFKESYNKVRACLVKEYHIDEGEVDSYLCRILKDEGTFRFLARWAFEKIRSLEGARAA